MLLQLATLILLLAVPDTPAAIRQISAQFLDCSSLNKTCSDLDQLKNASQVSSINFSNQTQVWDSNDESVCSSNQSGFICIPSNVSSLLNSRREDRIVQVFLISRDSSTRYKLGDRARIECRFRTISGKDVEFKLRWMKLVADSSGSTERIENVDSQNDQPAQVPRRVWTVHRDGRLDLELSSFQSSDAGNYSCQAILHANESIISEAQIELSFDSRQMQLDLLSSGGDGSSTSRSLQDYRSADDFYSQENLDKLLPSLKVVPEFSEPSIGDQVQLICITSEPDPDPEPDQISWTFEAFDRSESILAEPIPSQQMPANVSIIGNALIVWNMSRAHAGIYRCSVDLVAFNLSASAYGELALRPVSDSAPLVYITPEALVLSPNGTATIQCEATGFPRPTIVWYRIDSSLQESANQSTQQSSFDLESGIEQLQIAHKDTAAYCALNRCLARVGGQQTVPGSISLVSIRQAKASHQGQYVCRADNKHGSNQASSLVDVEFRESPKVSIRAQDRHQIIMLDERGSSQSSNVTFRCSVEAGTPTPRLKWLKSTSGSDPSLDRLNILDLTRASSATSTVSTWLEQKARTLVLSVSTVSLDDEGDYVCLAENQWGRHSAVGHLSVRRAASVRILQSSPLVVKVNESFHLDCLASGHPNPLDIEWSRSDRGSFFSLIQRTSSSQGQHEKALLKFDRVTPDEAGEYTCNARDPFNSSLVLRDTIMVLVEERSLNSSASSASNAKSLAPKLLVRPNKVQVAFGSNITLDCVAVSGLQPTIVEWLKPPSQSRALSGNLRILPYYRTDAGQSEQLFQFGSKLRLLNVGKEHEGIYQCNGRNRAGAYSAPALVKLLDSGLSTASDASLVSVSSSPPSERNPRLEPKTKVAKLGSNIELKCQVNGIEQPATSWSREKLELPSSSVQIGHNLWIQNVSLSDNGLYVCSARSDKPNKVIQATINLEVHKYNSSGRKNPSPLSAKIVASKSSVSVGDSITLECIVNANQTDDSTRVDLEELERNVLWTNSNSGQNLFQDNVYFQDNLLIIYELRAENSASYRCNFNELSQHVDYRLELNESTSKEAASKGRRVEVRQASLDSRLVLECRLDAGDAPSKYRWWRVQNQTKRRIGPSNSPLVFAQLDTSHADLYLCAHGSEEWFYLVQVLVPTVRLVQRPVSLISVPVSAGAEQQLQVELKFKPENETGLLLFNGQLAANGSSQADFFSLGLSEGHVEFRFELGDGATTLRSLQPVSLQDWHKVVVERNQRGAVMWIDRQPPVSNSSLGNFFNLNHNSLLYVGGHENFMNRSLTSSFLGYSKGFQGCISSLRLADQPIQLIAGNRSVSVGVFECDKPECQPGFCNEPNGICQPDRSRSSSSKSTRPEDELRCVCLSGFQGRNCQSTIVEFGVQEKQEVKAASSSDRPPDGICELSNPCSTTGTVKCQSLTSVSYKCHCQLGFMGKSCAQVAQFGLNESSAHFNKDSYLHFKLHNKASQEWPATTTTTTTTITTLSDSLEKQLQVSNQQQQQSIGESQEITFKVQSNSSLGLILYMGQPVVRASQLVQPSSGQQQSSKSLVANTLARLSSSVFDYLAIALVDGHVELSFELGSGVAILRSSLRVNDNKQHQIRVIRANKLATMIIDQTHKYQTQAPGKHSMLNNANDIYLGGLSQLVVGGGQTGGQLFGLVGCLSELKINSMGPINLQRSDQIAELVSGQNLTPCNSSSPANHLEESAAKPKPYESPAGIDSDDSDDEM